MFNEQSSGEANKGAAKRSSRDIPCPPPVVMLTMAELERRMIGRNCMNTAGSGVGRPSAGFLACKCRTAAPASAAAIDCSAISSGVSGK